MNREILPKDCVSPLVLKRIDEIRAAMACFSNFLDAPKGCLGISPHQGGYQYFQVTEKSSSKGDYIPQGKIHMARALAKRDFAKKALPQLQKNLDALQRFSQKYDPEVVEKLWCALHPARRALLEPLVLSDEEYMKLWSSVEYSGRPFDADTSVLMTARGERVRSKSEVIIADTLFRLGVPYRYEFPHRFRAPYNAALTYGSRRSVLFHPDFTCLNVRTRQEFIWEHFGLLDNGEYAQNVVDKLDMFHENGFYEGANLVFTFETLARPLDSVNVGRLVERFLL